jgi:uncharacterized membrane protein YphA (DoxX/SURF4 family)
MARLTNKRISNILGVILGVFFIISGLLKLFGNDLTFWKWAKESYLVNFPAWVYYASGIVEWITGIGLLFPRTRFIAAVGLFTMIELVSIHSWSHPTLMTFFPTIITLALLTVTWLRTS